jgi:hypothetical protein
MKSLQDILDEFQDQHLRELVFEVPDRELRREIMAKLGHYRYKLWRQYQMRRLFDDGFALRLRAQRCNPPRLLLEAHLLAGLIAVGVGVAYWVGGALDALVIGVGVVGVVLPALVLFVVTI